MVAWSSEYALGIPEIDAEHQQLVGMIAKLEAAAGEPSERPQVVRAVIDEINVYVVEHFRHEEELMEKSGYPHAGDHHKTHKAFARKVADLKLFAALDPAELQQILLEWLLQHILKTDRDYVPHVQKLTSAA